MKKIIAGILVAITIIVGFSIFGSYVSYNNQDVSIRKLGDAQRGKVEIVHDQMWKIIKEQGGVTENFKNSFDKIYTNIIEGRYSKGDGSLMKMITEANPNFDTKLYEKLMNSIEIQRTAFSTEQERMLDIINQHEVLINSIPSKWFISNTKSIEYTIISSTKTKEVMKSGTDDETLQMN